MMSENYTIDEMLERGEFSVRAYNVCKYNDMLTCEDICRYYRLGNSFEVLKNSGRKTVSELNGIVEKYNIDLFSQNNEVQQDASSLIPNELSDEQESILRFEYNRIISSLSVRANNVLKNSGYNYKTILQLVGSSREAFLSLKSCGEKTYKEILECFRPYKGFVEEILNFDDRQLKYLEVSNNFSFLTDNEKTFVQNFSDRNGYYPMFYIVMRYFARTDDRNEKIFVAIKGVGCDVNREIGEKYDLVYERTRQICYGIKDNLCEKGFFNRECWKHYEFLNDDYIIVDLLLTVLNESEFVECEHIDNKSLAAIIEILTNHNRISYNGYIMLFSERLMLSFDIKDSLFDINKTSIARCTKETSIPITTFIDTYWKTNNTLDLLYIKNCIKEICQTVFSIEVDNQFNCTIQQNAIDVKYEAYKIIEEYGQPMRLDEIFSAFKEKFPNHKYTQPQDLRIYLVNAENITPIGKTSTYAIDKWNISSQNIRDLAYDILCDSSRPMKLEELVSCIENRSRRTSINSLNTNILMDNQNRFVKFKGGYIGVSCKDYSNDYEVLPLLDIRRQSFDERLDAYISFIDTYHYSPQNSGSEEEQSLNRWYNNVCNGRIQLTEEQKQRFVSETQKRAMYFYTGREYNFMKKCDEYMLYVSKACEIPKYKEQPQLYMWFNKNYNIYTVFDDKRKQLFEALLSFLTDYGYAFE